MTTLFDVGDKITFQITGKVISYSCERTGDCYCVEVSDSRYKDLRVYVDTQTLIASKARKE